MDYQGNVIRPPSEADSILLQVTVGCSHNTCAFCGAYPGERYRLKSLEQVFADIEFAARYMPKSRRLFLLSGDALSAPQDFLTSILERVRARLPLVARVSAYASAKGLRGKTQAQLAALKALGLAIVYMGLESGHEGLLLAMGKQAGPAEMCAQAAKIKAAGLKLSVTVINGLAGSINSGDSGAPSPLTGGADMASHALATAQALSAMQPDQAAFLSLIAVPGTPLWDEIKAGRFVVPDALALLAELRLMLRHTEVARGLFLANHASNYLPLTLRLPKDKQAGLALLDAALAGKTRLKPERARRL